MVHKVNSKQKQYLFKKVYENSVRKQESVGFEPSLYPLSLLLAQLSPRKKKRDLLK